ncbi:glycosyltransferase family 2 protein [Helicobacter sp. 11S02629-2]|uniref:glycosyltransferase family 2 protein n=1 Tax=Helicobacter sp. 11S02629-2 TaxID=1476195 RepID=UPI000BA657C3|nr:glycosyltransferase family 2 protein [Helicobacter sp. 11S02629-2]PAF44398.1 hypothetical protein BKH40_05745 [Helicobacter sp. 11S02629-2]
MQKESSPYLKKKNEGGESPLSVQSKSKQYETRLYMNLEGSEYLVRFESGLSRLEGEVLVSLIVSNYNNEHYIDECILSLRRQSFKEIEIIIVDDASSDKSIDKLKEHAKEDARISLFLNSVRTGHPSLARNYGISIAKGKYIAFVDSDDYLDIDCVKLHYERLESANADIAYCDLNLYDDTKDIYKHYQINHANKDKSLVFNAYSANSYFWIYPKTSACFQMYKKEFFLSTKLSFRNCNFEDTDVSIVTLLCAKSICFLPKPLYVARINKRYGVNRSDAKLNVHEKSKALEGFEVIRNSYNLKKQKGIVGLEEGLLYVYFSLCFYYIDVFSNERDIFLCLNEAKKFLNEVIKDGDVKRFIYFNGTQNNFLHSLMKDDPLKFIKGSMSYARYVPNNARDILFKGIVVNEYRKYKKPFRFFIVGFAILSSWRKMLKEKKEMKLEDKKSQKLSSEDVESNK